MCYARAPISPLPYHLHGHAFTAEKSKGANGAWGATPWANGVDLMLASTLASIREVGLMVCEAVLARRRNHQLQTHPQAIEAIPGRAL